MMTDLEHSYQQCRRIARERARNFYYGFRLLPQERRDALCAIYAFMRYCDDIADGDASVDQKAELLVAWRGALESALAGEYGEDCILPAFHDAVRRYRIPAEYFRELIAGAEMDLSIDSYQTFDDLYRYCYRVASVVGLCSLHVFGFRDPAAKELAEQCGIAFQLTNILRDLRADAETGRVYLPLDELARFGYSKQELARGVYNQAFQNLMQYEVARAHRYYQQSLPLIEMVEPESRPALWAMIAIYHGILRVIERNSYNVFSRPAALSDMEKIALALRAVGMRLRQSTGRTTDWPQLA